jgi:transcriptional regulator with XRE-family HTH domain
MARDTEAIAGLRRALGERLAAFREAAGLTQEQLGNATHCDRSRISHLERGTTGADEQFWAFADEATTADGSLLRAFRELERVKQQHDDRVRTTQLAAAREKANRFRQDGAPDGSWTFALTSLEHVHHSAALVPTRGDEGELPDARTTAPSPDSAVTASQEHWRSVRRHLIERGTALAKQAAELYSATLRVPQAPTTIALPSWLPPDPVPLDAVTLEWEPRAPRPVLVGEEAELRPILPLRTPRHAFNRYTSAMRYLNPPRLFENRPSYRLLEVSLTPSGPGSLRFGLSTFFDKLDVSEALTHEFTAASMAGEPSWEQLPFRALLTEPFDLTNRTVCPGIATLTLRRNTTDGSATFFLLGRDPAKVAVGGRQYGVVPSGEFQPASIAPESMETDLDLWRNMVREYSEELLGQPEYDGSSGQGLDYECWPFYRDMQRARKTRQLRAYVLGVVLHALSLNAVVLTAVVIDDIVFDDIFRDLVGANAEGSIISSLDHETSIRGLPFEAEIVEQLLSKAPLGGTSAACIATAWNHRARLIGDHTT